MTSEELLRTWAKGTGEAAVMDEDVIAFRHGAEALALLRRLLKWARCDCGIECNCGPYTGSAACGHECQCGCEALRTKARTLLAEAPHAN